MQVEMITQEDLRAFRIQLLQEIRELLQTGREQRTEWLRGAEVRKMLKISAGTLQNLRISGKLNPSQVGSIYYYKAAEIHQLLSNGQHS